MSIEYFISGIVLSFIILVSLGIKWELEKKVVIPSAIVIGIASWAVVEGITFFFDLKLYQTLVLQVIVIVAVAIPLLLWRFFRDPERIPPENEEAILSPGDGRVIYVKKIENGEIPVSEKHGRKILLSEFIQSDLLPSGGHIVGIATSWLDVHVQRASIGGKITLLKHIRGVFLSLKKKEAFFRNERVLTVIENSKLKIGIVQIASRLVRQIVPYLNMDDEVKRGQRIGIIRFGSQVDLILPDFPSLAIQISQGEKVKAGLSIIATLKE